MRTSAMRVVMCLPIFIFLGSIVTFAQTGSKPAPATTDSEQVLRDILTEVRQLRTEMQQASVYTHRLEILMERIKYQQEQIVKLTKDVIDARTEVEMSQAERERKEGEIEELTKLKDSGMKGEKDLKALTDYLAEAQQREQDRMAREATVSADLDKAKATLTDLNKRLDDLDREMSQPAAKTENRSARKKP